MIYWRYKMKIRRSELKAIIEEVLEEAPRPKYRAGGSPTASPSGKKYTKPGWLETLPSQAKGLTVKKVKTKIIKADEDEWADDQKITFYHILNSKGKKVGFIETADDGNAIDGQLWGKNLPMLGGDKWDSRSGILSGLHRFFKTKSGQKWLNYALKQGRIK